MKSQTEDPKSLPEWPGIIDLLKGGKNSYPAENVALRAVFLWTMTRLPQGHPMTVITNVDFRMMHAKQIRISLKSHIHCGNPSLRGL